MLILSIKKGIVCHGHNKQLWVVEGQSVEMYYYIPCGLSYSSFPWKGENFQKTSMESKRVYLLLLFNTWSLYDCDYDTDSPWFTTICSATCSLPHSEAPHIANNIHNRESQECMSTLFNDPTTYDCNFKLNCGCKLRTPAPYNVF